MNKFETKYKNLPNWAINRIEAQGIRPSSVTVEIGPEVYVHGSDGIRIYAYKNGEISYIQGSYSESAINYSDKENKAAWGIGKVELKPGEMILAVKKGYKYSLVDFYAHPQDIQKLIPETDNTLTNDHFIVLMATSSLVSSYGGIKNFRFKEARRETGITLDRWDRALQELIAKKLLQKNKAITASGRNALTQKFGNRCQFHMIRKELGV